MNFQSRAANWAVTAFGRALVDNKPERNERFLEEGLELVQSLGMTRERAQAMLDYVYGEKTPGDPHQELGGVMVTLAVLAEANDLDMIGASEGELLRCYKRVSEIREKNLTKDRDW